MNEKDAMLYKLLKRPTVYNAWKLYAEPGISFHDWVEYIVDAYFKECVDVYA